MRKRRESPGGSKLVLVRGDGRPRNQILGLLPGSAMEVLAPAFGLVEFGWGETVFEAGDEVTHAHFPLDSAVVAFVLPMRDGFGVEAASIGREGVAGGLVSLGVKPAFARAVMRIPGTLARISLARLETAKRAEPQVHDLLARYADCLIAQVLQSVGCATLHSLEARCARWLLTGHDRLQQPYLPLTHDSLADMFGVARTYMTRIASALQDRGAISYKRGLIHIVDRAALEQASCECYALVRQHFDAVLPGLYPNAEP